MSHGVCVFVAVGVECSVKERDAVVILSTGEVEEAVALLLTTPNHCPRLLTVYTCLFTRIAGSMSYTLHQLAVVSKIYLLNYPPPPPYGS